MDTFDYIESANEALDLLEEFGRVVKIKRAEGGTLDPVEGSVSGVSDIVGNVTAAIMQASVGKNLFDESYREGIIRGTVKYVICDAVNTPFDPRSGDRLEFDLEEWEIFGVNTVSPSGTPVIHKMGVIKK